MEPSVIQWVFDPQAWAALVTLTGLEIVLGIDNIVILTILVGRLPPERRQRGRVTGLALAMLTRIGLLLSLAWMMRLSTPFFTVFARGVSGRDLILVGGGLFLLAKSTFEIHNALEGEEAAPGPVRGAAAAFAAVVIQIALIDIIFSLDSVITAVGMARDLPVMVLAIVAAVGIMMFAARPIGDFVDAHPTIKMLALSFLVLIGVALLADGLGLHIPKAYIYFAMAFSLMVEMLNMKLRRRAGAPVELRHPEPFDSEGGA